MDAKLNDFYCQIRRLYKEKNYSKLESYLCNRLSEAMVHDRIDSILISILNELATFYRGQNQPEKSIEYLCKAADVTKDIIGEDSSEYATLLMNLSAAYRINQNGHTAVKLADRAAKILKNQGEDQRYLYCAAINNKGMAYLKLREPVKARICFKEAMKILTESGFESGQNTEEVCVSMTNVAYTYYEENKLETAEEYCRNILKKYHYIEKDKRSHLYALYTLMGHIYIKLNRKEDAEKAYQKAMYLIETASGQNFEYRNIRERLERINK